MLKIEFTNNAAINIQYTDYLSICVMLFIAHARKFVNSNKIMYVYFAQC